MARGSLFQLSCLSGPGESSTPLLAATIAAVPELPDLTVVAEAFHAALSGRPIRSAEAPGPLAVRGTPAELAALAGQQVERIARRGKFLLIELDGDRVVVNPMLTGRFQLAAPGEKLPTQDGSCTPVRPARRGATGCRLLDRRRRLAAGR